jgi:quinolinate synthase
MNAAGAIVPGKVAIAAHHYQKPEIVARAGLVGDSYRLAVEAAQTDAEFIVLCGVRFMAESAAILARPEQTVVIPDMNAGCPMADMIDRGSAEDAIDAIKKRSVREIVPVAYMNSTAEVKALTGALGGSVCTSGNAKKVLAHYFNSGKSVFFMPDINLGMNTARALGLESNLIRRVTRELSIQTVGDTTDATDTTNAGDENLSSVRLFLWDGFCHVHRAFTADDVRAARLAYPAARIIVHPECKPEVTLLADESGSTEAMHRALRDAKDGTQWIIGTEGRFVERMAASFPEKTIVPLRVSYCHNMNRIDTASLDRTLAEIATRTNGEKLFISGTVTVADCDRAMAEKALRAMVAIAEAKE